MDIPEDNGRRSYPELKVCFVGLRVNPFKDVIDVKGQFEVFKEKSRRMNSTIMPAYQLQSFASSGLAVHL